MGKVRNRKGTGKERRGILTYAAGAEEERIVFHRQGEWEGLNLVA